MLSQVAGIEHVFSVSRAGLAVLTLQYEVGVPRTEALVRLYDVLNANSDWLPAGLGVQAPIVKPKGIDDVPVYSVTLWQTNGQGGETLERVANSVEAELKRVAGTREVKSIGGPGRAVRVLVDPARLRRANLSLDPIVGALQSANMIMPSGATVRDGATILVETGEFLKSADDVASIVVGVSAGRPIHLRDVAEVRYGPLPPNRYVWQMAGAGGPATGIKTPVGRMDAAITIAVTKKPGENAVDVTHRLDRRMQELTNALIPDDVHYTVSRDYGLTAADKASKLIGKLAFATASVIVLVGLALGIREAVIVGGAVILTLTATLFASWAWGFTLNRVSLFALIFSIGILVDDAIVVVENIHRHRALEPNKPLWQIIPVAVDEVGGPTILATLTVIAALLPMAFVTGLMGPYMSPIPINSSMGMLLSLAIAFVVTPWLALRLMRDDHGAAHAEGGAADHAGSSRVGRWLQAIFGAMLRPFIDREGLERDRWASVRRIVLLLLVIVALIGSVALVGAQAVILKMLPFDNKSEFQVVVDMPSGTPLESTNAVLVEMADRLARESEVRDIQGYAGTASPINFNGLVRQYEFRQDAEQGDLQVNLVDKKHRHRQSHAIAQAVIPDMEAIAKRHGARVKVVEVPPGPPVLSPLVAEVYGPDAAGRAELASRLQKLIGSIPGMVAIDSSLREESPKLRIVVDRTKAQLLGVDHAAIVRAARSALEGVDASFVRDGVSRRAVPIRVTLPEEDKDRIESVLEVPVLSASGKAIRLGDLVSVHKGVRESPAYHKNLLPVSYVVADMGLVAGNAIDSPLYGLLELRKRLAEAALPGTGTLAEHFISQPSDPYRQYSIKWDGEWQVTYETFRDMGIAYAVGLILIYLLVVAQFRSYLTPLIIMAPIPLTVIGVMPGHALLGAQFTATSMIGMIALAGIIVRNSILLVDFIELETASGKPFAQAVVRSAQVRAQPILLTALAAMLGAFFILDDPIFNGLAVALIFGILVSTLLTLVVIPVLYYLAFRRRFAQAAPAADMATSAIDTSS
ncbi:MAG: efflux RND transporter permease subunit [Burkholderiaceae bacterium]